MKSRAFTLAEVLITLGIIGVVAALTLPPLIHNHKKHVIETRLKQNYSLLYQAVRASESYNGQVSEWDYTLNAQDFINRYLAPYIKVNKVEYADDPINILGSVDNSINPDYFAILYLPNGSAWYVKLSARASTDIQQKWAMIIFNLDNNKKNKIVGKNIFFFYILPHEQNNYNCGWGDVAKKVSAGGVYPDGAGINENTLYTDNWRGCGSGTNATNNAYCTSVIIRNNWKIPDNYPIKL